MDFWLVLSIYLSLVLASPLARLETSGPSAIPLKRRQIGSARSRRYRRDDLEYLHMASGNQQFTATVTFGNEFTGGLQSFELPVDTGSGDTWVARYDFDCDFIFAASCDVGPLYTPGDSYVPLGAKLQNEYGNGDVLGEFGTEEVRIGGQLTTEFFCSDKWATNAMSDITLTTTIGVVTEGKWDFDGVTSGLLGLGGSALTSIFYGKEKENYDPIFVDMYKQQLSAPNFSLALGQNGGYLGFGVVPSVSHNGEWITVDMPPWEGDWDTGPIYAYYNITIDSFAASDFPPQDSGGSSGASEPVTLDHPYNSWMIVDSGSSANLLPDSLADAFNSFWDPPVNPILGTLDCDATAPVLGVTIGGFTFYHDPATLISRHPNGYCTSAIEGSGDSGWFVLGTPFLMNVLVVHDYENAQMRLTSTNPAQI
jgi:aspergillopepsin I